MRNLNILIISIVALILFTGSALAAKPFASFEYDGHNSNNPPVIIYFIDDSTNTPTSWNWNFGDGTSNATTKNVTHSYAIPGIYRTTLTVSNADGSTQTDALVNADIDKTIYITPKSPADRLSTVIVNSQEISNTTTHSESGLLGGIKSSISSGYILLSIGVIIIGAAVILRYLGYI
jgi:PKD repeat protein